MKSNEVAELYRVYGPVVYRRCLKVLGTRDQAQDATQEVFVKLLRHSERFADSAAAIPWAITVATHHCLHVLRDTQRRSGQDDALLHVTPATTGSAADAHDDRAMAREALASTDPMTRKIVVGVVVEEHEHEAMAQSLGVSSKTVSRKLQRFMDNARKLLSGRS